MPAETVSRVALRDVVARLAAVPGREERLTHLEVLPARAAVEAAWPLWVPDDVRGAFEARGIHTLWRHQVDAAEAAHAGRHVVMATGTASGKSLGYQLPTLTAIRNTRGPRGQRGAATLYLSPTKALAQDQLAGLESLGLDLRVATHDGDSPREQREWTRDHAEYVLTNPDMLHRSLLPAHYRWAPFLGSLRYVVVDECHHYRGVFGAHVAQVLRRLRRVCAAYGAHPTFVLASATVAEPEVHAHRLTGLDVLPVVDDGSPRGQVAIALWEPPFTSRTGEHGAPVRRAASSETADLLADLVLEGVRTLAFIRSRRGAEQVALHTAELLADVDPALAGQVAAYRGGYLPEERRAIERALRSGELTGLAATNALELGIDISGLDAVVMAGFPGTRAAMWQQVGRAGRGHGDALGVLVARDDPLDTYLVTHPEALFGKPVEATVIDPANEHVLGPHLCAAAQEVPLTDDDLELFGPAARGVLDRLVDGGPAPATAARLVLDRPPPGRRPHRHPLGRRQPGRPRRDRDRAGDRSRRPVERARHRRTPARSTCTAATPGWWSPSTSTTTSPSSRAPTSTGRRLPARSPTSAWSPSARVATGAGAASAWARSTSPTRWCRTSSGATPAERSSARCRSTCPSAACAPPRSGGPCPTTCSSRAAWPRSTWPAPPTPPSTARSGCCRCSRPATAGTSAGCPRSCTPTPAA